MMYHVSQGHEFIQKSTVGITWISYQRQSILLYFLFANLSSFLTRIYSPRERTGANLQSCPLNEKNTIHTSIFQYTEQEVLLCLAVRGR